MKDTARDRFEDVPYNEGDIVEVYETVAREYGNVLLHVITDYSPLREQYVIRPVTGTEHRRIDPDHILHRTKKAENRPAANADILGSIDEEDFRADM